MSKTCICALVPKFLVLKKYIYILKCYCSCVGAAPQSGIASCRRVNPEPFYTPYSCTEAGAVLGRAQVAVRGEEEPVGASSSAPISRTWSLIELEQQNLTFVCLHKMESNISEL